MKFITLQNILKNAAEELQQNAVYTGALGDGGSSYLLRSLENYRHKIAVKYDLRPSELYKVYDMEIGEPKEFKRYIEEYKISLAKNIKL